MAKKRGSGSNLGLIITLVFFVLTTVILGVTTYLGYSSLDEKEKAKADAEKAKGVADNDAKWNRLQARVYRAVMGHPAAGVDAAEVARDKKQFDDNQFAAASGQKDKDDVARLMQTLNQRMPWDAGKETAPSTTYEQRIGALVAEIDGYKARLKKADESVKRSEQEKKDAEDARDKEVASLKASIADLRKKANADRKEDMEQIAAKQALADDEGKKRAALEKQKDDALRGTGKLSTQIKDLQGKVTKSASETRELRSKNDKLQDQLSAVAEKYNLNLTKVEEDSLDTKAIEQLKTWNKPWRIVEMGRRGETPFINLGSADGLTAQVTFSIHSVGPNGKLNTTPKGTMEVIRIMGAHQAQARLTSTRDAKNDPIMKGDRLFNPTWDPSRKRHVAISGLVDLGGDGIDNTDELRRLLARQNVLVDSYIDVKDDKTPKLVGKGVTVNTDYLILGDSLDGIGHPRKDDKEYVSRFERLRSELKEQASNNGVTVLSLRRYLDMIGYQPPKIIKSGGYLPDR